MTKVAVLTLGCKQNKYESDCMITLLKCEGYEVIDKLDFADVYIINTCAVTKEAEKKSRQYVSKCSKANPKAKIIVCGCASQNNIEQFSNLNIYSIFGTESKEKIIDYINHSIKKVTDIPDTYCSIASPTKTTTREYLKIQDGCNHFCSYCLIPYLRGRSRSRDVSEIINEAKIIASRSHEIVITGIDISSFKVDGQPALTLLMQKLAELPTLISLGSLEVNVITEELMLVLKSMKNFSPHFHLSLQSGDDEILKKMNRHYNCQEFYDKVCLIKKYFPDCNLTTDVIVGFGEETEDQFNNTRDFIKKCGFSFVHIFPYSKREGTRAYNFPDIDNAIKKRRVDELELINTMLKNNYLSKFINIKSTMLAEEKKEFWEGFSREYIRCYSEDKLQQGKLYRVEFVSLFQDGLKVKILKGE